MVLISKHDKKVWEKYILNFEKTVVYTKENTSSYAENYRIKRNIYKNNKFNNNSNIFKKKRFKPDATLDLHGYSLYSAKLILHKYLINCYEKNIRNVLIITGKGQSNKGVLKEEVPKWLTDSALRKFLIEYYIAPRNFGGEGALILRIKNKHKKHN
jgi:DNA-nicking Smr family endonuclease